MATQTAASPSGQETRLLTDWRALDAYVLLGDPGAGKSCAFADECTAVGGVFISARNVVAGITPTNVAGRTVFIDGLDEVRAGSSNRTVPFDAIRKWLNDCGRPRFRLSCREADWLGNNDRIHLAQVAPAEQVVELHLDALNDAEIAAILADRATEVPDAGAFLVATRRAGLTEVLRNPLLLDLTIRAMAEGSAPRTRAGIYEAAVRHLAQETNEEHLAVKEARASLTENLVDDAGMLCAVLLLSGKRGISRQHKTMPDAVLRADLAALDCHDIDAALASNIFTTDAGVAVPRHRSIAEFLAARALARRMPGRIPLGRVMALMQGIDGVPVEPLRGLWAWLAVHHAPGRERLIAFDPLGFVLNGDAAALHAGERVAVLHALRDAALKDPWFRNASWVSHPFGALATADMAASYETLLREHQGDSGHPGFIDCVFDALSHGEAMPTLAPALKAWVENGQATSHLRRAAYETWKHCVGWSAEQALAWLRDIQTNAMPDSDDELLGVLLGDLYPVHVTPEHVFEHWHGPKNGSLFFGSYKRFWTDTLWTQTPTNGFAALTEGWLRQQPLVEVAKHQDYEVARIPSKLLAAALTHAGDQASNGTLYEWLGLCLDEFGFSRLDDDEHIVRTWLSERPERMKAVMAIGLQKIEPDNEQHWQFWPAESRLHGAARPRDWLLWLLDQAASAATPELARYCFFPAAHAAIDPVSGLDCPTMEQIETWVEKHKPLWPSLPEWLEAAWSAPLEHWRGEQSLRARRALAQRLERDEQRKRDLAPRIPSLLDGTATPGLLYHVAVAHEHGFIDVRGDTALARVRNYLGSDDATAQAVIDALPRVLDRVDLPTVEQTLTLEARGRQHPLRPAVLLAARMVQTQDADAPLAWSQPLAERLVACYLSDGTGKMPGWYRTLVQHRPDWVATVLVQYATPKLKRKGNQFFAGLGALASEADHAELTRRVLPALLQAFPLRASEAARGILNCSLLSALTVLDHDQAATIIQLKLRQEGMDKAQRICWLVADLPHRAAAAQDLVALVGRNERRAVLLGAALHEQGTLARVAQRLEPAAIQHLIEVLGPVTGPTASFRDGIVTASHHRGDTVEALFAALASDPSSDARNALAALTHVPGLRAWDRRLQYSLRTQAVTTREASFQVPAPVDVARALADLAPASPADLRALVVEHLCDLQDQWRGADTFRLQLFWRDSGKTPKTENDCRDLLLQELRERLKHLHISIAPERSAAQGKRADMCVEYLHDGQRMALPIEIKPAWNDALWTAWREQLQRLYTNDPDTQGYGLYLVLWFGQKVTRHPEGIKVHSAEQLRTSLEDRLPTSDRHRLAVRVMDLSWPVAVA